MEAGDDVVRLPFPDRRRGPRRAATISEGELPVERRTGDRRRRKPGVAALMGAVLSPPAIGLVAVTDEPGEGEPALEIQIEIVESRG
ncbi:MAG: hypothetical protein ABR975_10180 [Vulcanimicrobiaceae bacterium]|jgi:hypothetical protein